VVATRLGLDTEAAGSYHRDVTTWRCPHCGTPQADGGRCWVCHRSATSCGTCRHYRRAVAGQLGYCGLDSRRQPLIGDEVRGCWEAGVQPVATVSPGSGATAPGIDFIPVDQVVTPAPPTTREAPLGIGAGYGLFDLEG
jgi:hypothetical protein